MHYKQEIAEVFVPATASAPPYFSESIQLNSYRFNIHLTFNS